MARKRNRTKKSGTSPYVRYGKQPYQYQFRNCAHKTTTPQQAVGWAGRVCTVCNTITSGPK